MDFKAGEILLVNKPLTWTSFDVVNKLRWQLRKRYNQKKFKVGHAGTLDPLASGLLIICTGKATKKSMELMADDKTYIGTILFGKTTPSFDLETEFDGEYPTEHITTDILNQIAETFLGEQFQTPPAFSAKKIDGKRAYESARKGIEIEMRKNLINITDLKIDTTRFPEVDFEIKCSKGTYIRSFAADFGKKVNSGATLIALTRTQSGKFNIKDAKTIKEWIETIQNTRLSLTE